MGQNVPFASQLRDNALDAICSRFESEMRNRQQPRIEQYLAESTDVDLRVLLRELLVLELESQTENGLPPSVDEFTSRFPGYETTIADAFRIAGVRTVSSLSATDEAKQVDSPAVFGRALSSPFASPNSTETRYEIVRELGRGGMAVVYEAHDRQLKRSVALKMMAGASADDPKHAQRFRAEAEAVARLKHPGIVQIHDFGELDGQPFLALELVRGCSLAEFAVGRSFSDRWSAQLIETIARTIHFAHEHNVVHRDLTPGNILLEDSHPPTATVSDEHPGVVSGDESWPDPTPISETLAAPSGDSAVEENVASLVQSTQKPLPVVKVTDFGLAKQFGTDSQTMTGELLGTPRYMAPEQADGRVSDVGPAADVYALGAMLYELLTGRPPFLGRNAMDMLLMVRYDEPVAPTQLRPRLSLDVQTICLQCLAKEPSKRYATAADLADDLRRFLNREPILARQSGFLERTGKFCRRRPALAGLLGTLAAVFLIGLPVMTGLYFWADHERSVAAGLLTRATQAESRALDLAGRERESATRARIAERDARSQLARVYEARARNFLDEGDTAAALLLYAQAFEIDTTIAAETVKGEPSTLRDPSTGWSPVERLHRQRLGILLRQLPVPQSIWPATDELTGNAPLYRLAPHANHVVRVENRSQTSVIRLLDLESGEPVIREINSPARISGVWFSPQGRYLAATCDDQIVRLWNASDGKPARAIPHDDPVVDVSFDWHELLIATARKSGTARVWEAASGRSVSPPIIHDADGLNHLELSADGTRLLTWGSNEFRSDGDRVRTWDVSSGKQLVEVSHKKRMVSSAAFSPDGQRVVSGGLDGNVIIWEADTGETIAGPYKRVDRIASVQFSPDGRSTLETDWAYFATVRNSLSGEPRFPEQFYTARLSDGRFSPDGSLFAVAGYDATARLWRTQTGESVTPPLSHSGPLSRVEFSSDSRFLLTAGADQPTWIRDLATVLRPQTLHEGNAASDACFISRRILNGQTPAADDVPIEIPEAAAELFVATAGQDGLIRITPIGNSGFAARSFDAGAPVLRITASPDGDHLLTVDEHDRAIVWDITTGQQLAQFPALSARFNPDGRLLACTDKGAIRVYDWRAGTTRLSEKVRNVVNKPFDFAFDAGSRILVTGGIFAAAWDLATGKQLTEQSEGHSQNIKYVTVTPDGTLAASIDYDGLLRVWETATGALQYESADPNARMLHCSPDGRYLISGHRDGTMRIRDFRTGQPIGPVQKHGDVIYQMAQSATGETIATVSQSDTIAVWNIARRMGTPARPESPQHPDGRAGVPILPGSQQQTAATPQLLALLPTGGQLERVAVSPDGQSIVAVSASGAVSQWTLPPRWTGSQSELNRLLPVLTCSRVSRNLDMERLSANELLTHWNELHVRGFENEILQPDSRRFRPQQRITPPATPESSRLITNTVQPSDIIRLKTSRGYVSCTTEGRIILDESAEPGSRSTWRVVKLRTLDKTGRQYFELWNVVTGSPLAVGPEGQAILSDDAPHLWNAGGLLQEPKSYYLAANIPGGHGSIKDLGRQDSGSELIITPGLPIAEYALLVIQIVRP
jgi:WD40 repeat protein/serine/threonine protein kinase